METTKNIKVKVDIQLSVFAPRLNKVNYVRLDSHYLVYDDDAEFTRRIIEYVREFYVCNYDFQGSMVRVCFRHPKTCKPMKMVYDFDSVKRVKSYFSGLNN